MKQSTSWKWTSTNAEYIQAKDSIYGVGIQTLWSRWIVIAQAKMKYNLIFIVLQSFKWKE